MRLILSLALLVGLAAPAGAQVAFPNEAGRDVVQNGLATGLKVILQSASAEAPPTNLLENASPVGADCPTSLRGGPQLGCDRGGSVTAQLDAPQAGSVPTSQAARQPDAAVSLGGVAGFPSLADAAASARFRASGRGGYYLHFSATGPAFQPSLPSIASAFSGTGPGVLEVSYSNTGSGGGFTPDFWGRSDYVERITSKGFFPTVAIANLDYGADPVNTPWNDGPGFGSFVDNARSKTSVRIVAPVIAPNQSGGPGPTGDAGTVAVRRPWSDDFWSAVKAAALHGGGIALDPPPAFYFKGLPTQVQQEAYQRFIQDVIGWAHHNKLWVTVLVSPYFDKTEFAKNAQRFYEHLRSRDRLPSNWAILNYNECGPPAARACNATDATYLAPVGTETTPNSQAAVALWYARHARVRPYTGTYAGVLARPAGQVAPARINRRDGADQRIQTADIDGTGTMAGEASTLGATSMDATTVNGALVAGTAYDAAALDAPAVGCDGVRNTDGRGDIRS